MDDGAADMAGAEYVERHGDWCDVFDDAAPLVLSARRSSICIEKPGPLLRALRPVRFDGTRDAAIADRAGERVAFAGAFEGVGGGKPPAAFKGEPLDQHAHAAAAAL